MPASGEWLQEFQYFRAIAIIEVIVIHATSVVQQTDLTNLNLTKDIVIGVLAFTSFGVMHFLFISGVVLYNKYRDGFSLSMFYKKRFSAVLPPYLIFSTFYFFYPYLLAPLYSAVSHQPTITAYVGLAQLMSQYVTGLVVGIDQLWFIVLIMQLYLLYPFLIKFYGRFARHQHPLYALVILLLVQIAFTSAFLTTGPTVYRAFFLNGIFYFVLGFFIAEHFVALKQKVAKVSLWIISLAVALSTIYFVVIFYHTVLLPGPVPPYYVVLYQATGPFYCLLLILFYFRIAMRWGKPRGLLTKYLEKVGEDSFGIFLTHYFFISAFEVTLPLIGISFDNLLFYPTLVFLTLICSQASVQALYRLPGSALLVGKRRRKETIGLV